MNSVDHAPPRLATQLLRRFCDPRWLEEIEGDLQEQFAAQARDEGLLKARLVYWRDVLRQQSPGMAGPMPPLGTLVVDPQVEVLLTDWILDPLNACP